MRILILGGTVFLGRHLAEAAVEAGQAVTLFHRGSSHPDFLEGRVERLLGDRGGDLDALRGRRWDVAIDTMRQWPEAVERSAGLLTGQVGAYVFISTVSVYRDFGRSIHTEASPLALVPSDPEDEDYPSLKVRSERIVRQHFPETSLVVRPGLIVGPDDPTDRFTYWVRRLRQGGDLPAPGSPERPVQLIDVRDLAQFVLQLVERGTSGTFNTTGPATPLTLGSLLERGRRPDGPAVRCHWIPEETLLAKGLQPYSQLPLWLPAAEYPHANEVDCARALAAGLRFRDLEATVSDTAAWDRARGEPPLQAGLSAAEEADLLAAVDRAP